jgi:glyoxylase-like metal-dependent hydrolase (beta-lactamase superfamily II)
LRVKVIYGPGGSKFPFSNCLVVESGSARLLVDTGCAPNLPEGGFNAVIYTHFHPDHIRGYREAASRAQRVLAPEGEAEYRSLRDLAVRFAPGASEEWLSMASAIGLSSVPEPSEYYKPGEDVCVAGVCIKTYPARGHLLTHTLVQAGGTLHLVDIDLTGFGPWYANPEANPALFLSDIEMAAGIEAERYVTAHKQREYTRSEAVEALAAYAVRLVEQAEAVYMLLRESDAPVKPSSLAGRGAIYRRFLPGFERIMAYFESMMIEKLLGLLGVWGCAYETRRGWLARDCSLDDVKRAVAERVSSQA